MTLQEIYAQIPTLNCQRKCQECCGPIMLSNAEFVQIYSRKPRGSEKVSDKQALMANVLDLNCPKLGKDGACKVYEKRPIICRLWGVVRAMECPYGCRPERWLSDEEARRLIDACDEVSTIL